MTQMLSELFWSHNPRLLEAASAQGGVCRMGGRLEGVGEGSMLVSAGL